MRRFIYTLSIITILLCASPVFANYSPMPGIKSISALPSVLLLDYASDLFFIMLSLLILKQAGKIKLSTILKVSILTLAAGFAADEVGLWVNGKLIETPPFNAASSILFIGIIASVLLITITNFIFARHYFKLDHRQSLIMGLIVGILTMPGGVLLVSSVDFHLSRYNYHYFYTYSLVGTIFAAADIALLFLMKPITSLNRVGVGALGLVIAAGTSWYCLNTIVAYNNEDKDITACSSQMFILATAIMSYQNKYGEYPSDISKIPVDLLPEQDKLHCKFDKERSGVTSYIYRKPLDDIKKRGYWMLKCTHYPKYDLYMSADGLYMKALPKGESYK
ncbi:MAG: hypothetical protein ACYC27_13880 [Armatimonadota bacterium]